MEVFTLLFVGGGVGTCGLQLAQGLVVQPDWAGETCLLYPPEKERVALQKTKRQIPQQLDPVSVSVRKLPGMAPEPLSVWYASRPLWPVQLPVLKAKWKPEGGDMYAPPCSPRTQDRALLAQKKHSCTPRSKG